MLSCDLKTVFNLKLILFTVAAIFLTAAVLVVTVPRIIQDRAKAGNCYRGHVSRNFAILGIPWQQVCWGSLGRPTMTLIPFGMILYNVLTVFNFSDVHGGEA